jgi:hypothetical protein
LATPETTVWMIEAERRVGGQKAGKVFTGACLINNDFLIVSGLV